MNPDKKVAKGFSLYITGDEYVQLFNGAKTADFVVGFVVAKLKPVFEQTEKLSTKPTDEKKEKEAKK